MYFEDEQNLKMPSVVLKILWKVKEYQKKKAKEAKKLGINKKPK